MTSAVYLFIVLAPVTAFYVYPNCPNRCICLPNFTDCKYNNFTELPQGLDSNVTVLDLSYNEFLDFPETLNYYPTLVYLNLSHNKIQSLGVGVFQNLKNLERLDLTYNMFSDWMDIRSDVFRTTPKLTFLDLSHNALRSLPGEKNPLQIASLEILRLKNCSMEDVNYNILDKLPKLKELHLSENPIKRLTSPFISDSLVFIDLSRCNLQHINPKVFTGLTALQTIYMHQNINLKRFSCDSPTILYLDLSDCNLESVPSGNLSNVYSANFHGNHFRTLPDFTFVNYSNLKNLDLSYNAISKIENRAFEGLTKIKKIDLSRNTLSEISRNLFASNFDLIFLNLSRNYFSKVQSLDTSSLESLDLSSCEIQSVDRDFLLDMPNLRHLNLSNNVISLLPDNLQGDSLETLDISLCRIKNVNNKTFDSLTSLRQLYLSGNRLTSASQDSFLQVLTLDISDNPWRCECSTLKDLYTWLIKTGKRTDNLYCQSPEKHEGKSWLSACQLEWYPETSRADSVWWYTTGLIVTLFVILFVILAMRRMYLLREKRSREAYEARRAEERERLQRMRRATLETREEASRNAPDPRELQTPPSYTEALLLPRLDSSHPSLAGSLHSIASKHSITGSLNDVSKRSRPRRKRRRRKSDSSEGQRASRVVVDSDSSAEEQPQPRTTLESDF